MIKKILVGAVAALGILLVSHSSASAAYMQTSTLKMGSTGSQVMALQQALNMTSCKVSVSGAGSPGMETSTFAGKTKAAVMCFQAANGLKADGVVGPMTGAALAAVSGSTSVNTGLPAGCSSTSGYSTVSGAPCSGNAGSTAVYPAGCVSSVGYSSTTGQPCSGSGSTGVSTSGPFSINNISAVSGYSNTQVAVGAADKTIGDLRIVAGAGGTGNLTGVNVTFYNRGNGDYQFIKYASAVSVWLNGVKVGTLPATSFTQYNSQYSAFIPVSGAVLNPNTTNDLQLSVSALPVIDSANLGSTHNTFVYDLNTIRYTDSTGSYSYSVPSSSGFLNSQSITTGTVSSMASYAVFANAASASNISLTVTKDVNDYTDRVVAGQTASTSTGVTLATIDLTAQGSAVIINRIPVTVTVTNSGSGSTNAGSLINTLRLYNASGVQLDSETVPASAAPTVTFQNLNLSIPSGSTQVFTIKGDVNSIDGTVVIAGATARVDVSSTNVGNIQAYDSNNNVLNNTTSNILLGSTTGSTVTFYVNGIQVTNSASTGSNYGGSATASAPGGTQSHTTLGFTIPFSVTAFGQNAYVPSTATAASSASAAHTIQFCLDTPTGTCQAVGTGVISYNGSDNLTVDGSGNYLIPVGQTKNFTLQVTYTATAAGSYRASLLNVNWSNSTLSNNETNFSNSSATGAQTFVSGLNSNAFRTNYTVGS